jgi:signal transduction histidine kinase
MGMPISFDIIQQHGGLITVDSQPGVLTTFTVTLPLAGNQQANR